MTKRESPGWHSLFLNAMLEPVNSPHLSRLVNEAETAISQRLQELRVSATGSTEREVISEAFLSLRYLRDQGMMHSNKFKTFQLRLE
jgi:hypothetical protein